MKHANTKTESKHEQDEAWNIGLMRNSPNKFNSIQLHHSNSSTTPFNIPHPLNAWGVLYTPSLIGPDTTQLCKLSHVGRSATREMKFSAAVCCLKPEAYIHVHHGSQVLWHFSCAYTVVFQCSDCKEPYTLRNNLFQCSNLSTFKNLIRVQQVNKKKMFMHGYF